MPFMRDVIHREKHLEENKGETKMKTLNTILMTAVVLSGAAALSAQTKATANVPFEFTVQNTTLPAGEYTISKNSTGRDLMLIQNVEAHKAVMVIAPSAETAQRRTESPNVVVFRQIGDRYFLEDVKTSGVCGHVAPSKLERELVAETGSHPIAAVIVAAVNVR